jgi:hypothetical protein
MVSPGLAIRHWTRENGTVRVIPVRPQDLGLRGTVEMSSLCFDVSWTDRIDTNAFGSEFASH